MNVQTLPHKCPMAQCHRNFAYKYQLKQHLLLEERQFVCRHCKEVFEGKGPLISHLWSNDECKIEHRRKQNISDSQDRAEMLKEKIENHAHNVTIFRNQIAQNRKDCVEMENKLTEIIFHTKHLAVLAKTKKKQQLYRKKITKLKIDFLKDFQNYQTALVDTSKNLGLLNRNCGVRGCVGKSNFEIDRHRPWYA